MRLWIVTLVLNLVGGAVLIAVLTVDGALPAGSAEVLVRVAEEIAGKEWTVTLARAVLAGALITLLSYMLEAVDTATVRSGARRLPHRRVIGVTGCPRQAPTGYGVHRAGARADLRKCIRTNLDCADICEATGRVLSRQTEYDAVVTRAILEACAGACRTCGDECQEHGQHGDEALRRVRRSVPPVRAGLPRAAGRRRVTRTQARSVSA